MRKALFVSISSLLLLVGLVAPANAASAPAACSVSTIPWGTHRLNASASYFVSGFGDRIFTDYSFQLSGAGTGGKSNMYIAIAGPSIWQGVWASGDNLRSGPNYLVNPADVVIPGIFEPHVEFEAVFDVFGPDPRCVAGTRTI